MGGTFFQGIVLALAGFSGSLSHFLVNFSYCWSPHPLEDCFLQGSGKGDALWVPRHTTSGPLVGAGAFGLYCAPLATRWRPGSTTRLSVIQPRANLEICLAPASLHGLGAQATGSPTFPLFSDGCNIRPFTQEGFNKPRDSE